jgi:hypothetical protein
MAFKEEIEAYVGSFSDTGALDVWLNQAVRVILDLTPAETLQNFAKPVAIASGVTALGDKKLVSVTSNAGYAVRQAPPGTQGLLGDSESIHYATARTPAFVLEGNLLYLFPADLPAKMFVLEPANVTTASSTIPDFPAKLKAAVILYTAIQARIKQLSDATLALADVDLTGITAPDDAWPAAPTINLNVADPNIPDVNVTVPDVAALLESAYTRLLASEDIELTRAEVETILSRLNGARLQAEVAIANLDAAKTRLGLEELKVRVEIAKIDAYRAQIAAISEKWQTYRMQIQARIDEFSAKLAKSNAQHSRMLSELELMKREYNQILYLAIGVTQPGVSISGEPVNDH